MGKQTQSKHWDSGVGGVFVFPARHSPAGLEAGNPLAGRGEVWVWSGPATAEPRVSKCGLRTSAPCKLLAGNRDETRAGIESRPL